MRSSYRRLVIVLAAAVFLAACSQGDDAVSETATDSVAETTSTVPEPAASDDEEGEVSAGEDGEVESVERATIDLGDREAGFGPGSLAVQAGLWAERITELEGDWRPLFQAVDLPEVCGFADGQAAQQVMLVRPVDELGVRSDVVSVEVRIFESADTAAALVAALNGDTADDCDLASLELVETVPGIEFDFGDGVGTPTPPSSDLPSGLLAEARLGDFDVVFGSVRETVFQKQTVVADGNVVLAVVVAAAPDDLDQLEAEVVDVLFSEPAPEAADQPDLDVVVDQVRNGVLLDEDFPEFYDQLLPLAIGGPGDDDVCFDAAPPIAEGSGPEWLAFTPGAGGSAVSQRFEIYADADLATLAFQEVADRGLECFPQEFGDLAAAVGGCLLYTSPSPRDRG